MSVPFIYLLILFSYSVMSIWRAPTCKTYRERDYFQFTSMHGIELCAELNSVVSFCLLSLSKTWDQFVALGIPEKARVVQTTSWRFQQGQTTSQAWFALPRRRRWHPNAAVGARRSKSAGVSSPALENPSKGDLGAAAQLQIAECGLPKVLGSFCSLWWALG